MMIHLKQGVGQGKIAGCRSSAVVREGFSEEVPLKVKPRVRRFRLDRTRGRSTVDGGRVSARTLMMENAILCPSPPQPWPPPVPPYFVFRSSFTYVN